jgi:DNA processing protein
VLNYMRMSRLRGVGPILAKRLLEALGSPEAILAAHPANLAAIEGIGTVKANQIVTSAPETLATARDELARARQHGITLMALDDDRYPPALKTIVDPPTVLYVRGEILPQDAVAVGMVGARKCTIYGREQAQRLGAQLAERGLTIISGGARGIDTAAHLGALQAGGRTIVATGCGLLHTYPPENEGLYERIVKEGRGAIISELPLDAPPSSENFPPRNRIIAGMSLGVVVVEANLQSGSLITARLAAADYGREVFALPGRVDSPASAGTHHLIKTASAHLVESADDILDYLGDVGRLLAKANETHHPAPQTRQAPGLTPALQPTLFENQSAPPPPAPTTVQEKILAAIPATGASVDEIVETAALPAQVVMAELTILGIQKKLKRLGGTRYGPV